MDDETERFLAEVMPRFEAAELALHNGDPSERIAMWSHEEPVSLFGAAVSGVGWPRIEGIFRWLGETFADCSSYRNEVVAAQALGDLAYVVAREHTTASVGGKPPAPYQLRVTTVYRREDGEWRIVHRHGDPATEDSVPVLEGLGQQGRPQ